MAPFAKVYALAQDYRFKRAQVIGKLNGLEIEQAEGFQMGVTNKTDDYLAKFPMGKIPAMETADGFCLAESAAIAAHIAASGPKAEQLMGRTVQARSKILEWSFFSDGEFSPNVLYVLVVCVMKLFPADEARYAQSVAGFERALGKVEKELTKGNGKFLVGDELTLADMMVGAVLLFATSFLFDAEAAAKVPAVAKYLEGLLAIPEIKEAFGELKFADARVKP